MSSILRKLSVACLVLGLAASRAGAQTDPALVGQWSTSAPLPYSSTALHLLPSGMVMFYGVGSGGNDTRLWDPATGTVSLMAKPGFNVFCSGHTFLADGRLLILGGHIANNEGLPNASTYDAVSDAWTAGPNMNAGRWYPTATTLANGDVLVVSGDIDTVVGVNTLPQVFQPAGSGGTWRDLTAAQLQLVLYPQMHLAPNGQVFMSGAGQATRYLDTSGTGAWTFVAQRIAFSRSYGSSVMYGDGKVLVMGGGDPPNNTAEVIDLNAPTPAWRAVGSMANARRQINATLLADGKVLVTGGTRGAGFNNTDPALLVTAAEMWDPATELWTTMASAQAARIYHSAALLLPDGRVLTTGGDGITQVEVYSPPYLFAGARPTISSAPAAVGYGQTFLVGTPDAASTAKVNWIRLGSVTHAFDMNQRINSLGFSQAADAVNVVAPSNPNLAPPGHYMLFILNASGVPSEARIVRLDAGGNQAPVVNAGADQTITLPNSANLTGTASDDGLPNPPAQLATTWSRVSGPGTVTFGNASARSTTASFSVSGVYALRLTASDGALSSTDDVIVTVNPAPGTGTGLLGQYYNDPGTGARFVTLVLTRTDPTVNFTWNTASPGPGVTVDNFSVRWTGQVEAPVTGNFVFSTVSDDGVRLWVNGVQVINNWTDHGATTNNSAAIALVAGTKYSITMEFYERAGAAVARLLWAYPGQAQTFIPQSRLYPAAGSPNQAPTVNAGADQTITLPSSVNLAGSATDDGLPNPPGTLTRTWSSVSGPGTVTFGNVNALSTTASFSTSGSYVLRLTASDNAITVSDDVAITVNPTPGATGTGLTGRYYNDPGNRTYFVTPVLTRTDPTVNFDWVSASPGPGVTVDNFSVRWTGQVEAPVTGNFVFGTVSDDGVRLWVNGVQVINNWTDHGATTNNSAAVALVAGAKYSITMEFYERAGWATARLLWSYPGQGQTVIPQSRLFP